MPAKRVVQPDGDVRDRLNTLWRRLRQHDNTQKVWQLFTERQRKLIENHPTWQDDIVTMWSKAKRVSRMRAIIDMSYGLGWLGPAERDRLRKQTGESGVRIPTRPKPVYKDGLLTYDGEVVRRVQQFKRRSNLQILLDAFHAKSWRRTIENPWLGQLDEEKVYRTVMRLNENLQTLVFEVIEGGDRVRWTVRG